MAQIVLASGSPRRRELLERIGVTDFVVRVPEVEENFPEGLSPQEVLAMGDRASDISMLQLAGIGVAPANADPEVKDAANHITASCDQDAVALALERFVLNDP